MNRGWANLEAFDINRLDCFEKSVGRNMDAKGDIGEGLCVMRNMVENATVTLEKKHISPWTECWWKIKCASAEISEENKKHIMGNLRKGDPYYKVADNLAELVSTVGWKAELVSNELGYIAKENSKQNVGDMAWFYLFIYFFTVVYVAFDGGFNYFNVNCQNDL